MVKQKKEIVKPKAKAVLEKIIYPINKNPLFFTMMGLAFLVNFIMYLLTLAPTVTLEDSGELVTAAYFLGVPHEPGYPLFTIFGKIFSLLPIGNIAYRVNVASAFMTSAGAMILFYSIVLFLEDVFIRSEFWKNSNEKSIQFLKYGVALAGSLFFGLAFETWEQSIIAEVYGVNNFFLSLFILIFLLWKRQEDPKLKTKYFYLVCLVTGIAFTTHTTAAMLIAVIGGYILFKGRKLLLNFKLMGKGILFFILGLTPWLYIIFASMHNPPMDWGNPENITNFFRVVMRHQYQFQQDVPNSAGYIFTFFYREFLPEQWIVFYLLLIPVGMYILFKNNKALFWFIVFFLIMAIPVMSYLTRDYLSNDENKALVSIAYIPAYMVFSILISTGIFYLATVLKKIKPIHYIIPVIAVIIALSNISKNYKKVDMHNYRFAEQYADNIFNNLPKNALLFINWDPFGFPLNYYQFVENKRKDIIVIDQLLLKRSWYITWLRNYFPEFMKQSQSETEGFLKAVAPFESSDPYDGNNIQSNYIAMINSLIDKKIKAGCSVYFTYNPEKDILRNNHLEPQFAAYKYTNSPFLDSTVSDNNVNLNIFTDPKYNRDRMANYMSEYYADLYVSRANIFEQIGKKKEACSLYQKALPLLEEKSKKAAYTGQRILLLKNEMKGN